MGKGNYGDSPKRRWTQNGLVLDPQLSVQDASAA